ncbi:SO2930 family diheme c-type cytochrome [Marivirga arenosa]|uniref:SO2930 family diheme c-type cytochrome n=1 Tax=Marivirga arenosa TaxID=3059076 RepID=A0AA49JAD1_9BACT|nr:SO2930 family diheme c-type cytochrome [Marivirga sp. ABR2-2]WKK86110.1 SO2930 family diheme c-type cytochrome [Marivirga sp. ABR2-2]
MPLKKHIVIILAAVFTVSCYTKEKNEKVEKLSEEKASNTFVFKSNQNIGKEKLSDYNFFKGELKTLEPGKNVHPYTLNSPLFSDYAQKARFVMIPEGKEAQYHSTEVLEFPVGSILIKNFYYPSDFSNPDGERRIIETRLLIHEEEGWKALPYVWNDEQTEAFLEVAGATKSVSWRDTEGNNQKINYSVPNMNQCRSCHLKNGKITPIGPSARQLNGDYNYTQNGNMNQLAYWEKHHLISDLPSTGMPKLVNYEDDQAPLADRARAYLEINCGHCHRPDGPAKNSALHLMASVDNPAAWGVGKTPIAAGKGSGGLKYDIVPGHPEESILAYRMESTDPGIMMPELGRQLVHKEGLELVKNWIAEMK